MPPRIKLVVSDIDGTLLDDTKALSQRTLAMIDTIMAKGVHFALMSARPPSGITPLVQSFAQPVAFGAFNGGKIVSASGETLVDNSLDGSISRDICALVREAGAGLWVFASGRWFASDLAHRLIAREQRCSFIAPERFPSAGLDLPSVDKIVAVCDDLEVCRQIQEVGSTRWRGRAQVSRSQPHYCDFTHQLADKAIGLDHLAALYDVDLTHVAAIGDGENDKGMLRSSGLSVAMGQASEPVRRAAQWITTSNLEEGVARALERMLDGGWFG